MWFVKLPECCVEKNPIRQWFRQFMAKFISIYFLFGKRIVWHNHPSEQWMWIQCNKPQKILNWSKGFELLVDLPEQKALPSKSLASTLKLPYWVDDRFIWVNTFKRNKKKWWKKLRVSIMKCLDAKRPQSKMCFCMVN